MSFVSYAQNFEDVLLHRIFGGRETGFYVDVGAFHPVVGSVTKAFYDRGWSGINIEPGAVFAELAQGRPRDVNLRMAVLDRAGEVAFIEDATDPGTSRVCTDLAAAAPTVPCDTLQAIVDAHSRNRPVDFIKIDAEGAEGAIVRSTDWRRLRPRVLLIEATRPWSSLLCNEDWEPVLFEQGYARAYFDGINCFYVPEEHEVDLLPHFEVPVNALDRVERHDDHARHAALQAREAEVAHLTAERDAARTAQEEKIVEAARLSGERDGLHAGLESLRAEARHLTAECAALRASLDKTAADAATSTDERDTLRAALDTTVAETTRLAAERDAALASRDATHAYAVQMTAERDALRTALGEKIAEGARLAEMLRTRDAGLAPPPAEPSKPEIAATRPRSPLRRRAALALYRLVRPVARPAAWRLRTFLTGDLIGRIHGLDARIDTLARAPAPALPPVQPTIVQMREDGAAVEMRRLATEMERTLLTLALERAPEPWPQTPDTPAPAQDTIRRTLPDARSA